MRLVWLLAFVCSLIPAAALAQTAVTVTPEAKRLFKTGVELLLDPGGARYEEAYRSFKSAYAISPSPKMLGNIGLCAMQLERDGEAIAAYERYLAQGGYKDEAERRQIERDLGILKSNAAALLLRVTPPDAVLVDRRIPVKGEPVVNRYQAEAGVIRGALRAGIHRLTLSCKGYPEQSWELTAKPGSPITREVVLLQPSAPPGGGPDGPSRFTAPVIAGIVATGVLGIGAGVVGGLSLANKADFESERDAGNLARAADLRDTGETLNIATDILLGSTAAAAVVTTILFLTAGARDEPAAAWLVAPALVVNGGAQGGLVTLQGRF